MKKIALFSLIILILQSGCKEQFPVYEEPTNVLEGSIVKSSSDTLYVIFDDQGNYLGADNIQLSVMVKNIYPQLLQGDALISGRVNFFATSPLPKVGTPYTLSRNDLANPPIYQNSIAVPPNQSAELRVSLGTAVGRGWIFDGVPSNTVTLADSTVVTTYVPMTITVTATAQIFERVQAIQATPLTFNQTFVYMIVKSKQ